MISDRAMRIGRWLGAAAIAMLLAGLLFWILGSAIVIDRNGQVVAAAIVTSGGEVQALHRLPGGLFYAMPGLEGTIELRCRDGSRRQWGYVTAYAHTWLSVEPGAGCGRIVEAG
ncbi:MAG TPA: hypothetical protein VMG08_18025 [Allosphingosinicella sp.]|nr:hypothetical protein [Allosphingosinicella sp.]